MIGVKACGFLAERFFVTDGNIAAYVNKNAATLICRPHCNIGGYRVRHRACEAQGGDQGEDGLGASIFAGREPRTVRNVITTIISMAKARTLCGFADLVLRPVTF